MSAATGTVTNSTPPLQSNTLTKYKDYHTVTYHFHACQTDTLQKAPPPCTCGTFFDVLYALVSQYATEYSKRLTIKTSTPFPAVRYGYHMSMHNTYFAKPYLVPPLTGVPTLCFSVFKHSGATVKNSTPLLHSNTLTQHKDTTP